MKENNVEVAIIAAVNAYMQEEAKVAAPCPMPATFSPWKLFGLQESMRKRNPIQKGMRR